MARQRIDMRGKEYGHWLVLGPAPDKVYKYGTRIMWFCLCRGCKRTYTLEGSTLRTGRSRSCWDCWIRELTEFCRNR